ncbi:MAG: hypothetical protein WCD38_01090 [Candidatus Tumulicola sp.]
MSERSAATLHVTNGDSVLYLFKKAGILGTHVAWRDPLNEGPVPAGLPLEATSAARVRYLCERGYGNPIKVTYEFEKRDAQMRKAVDFPEVVLWFEHDLFDQLHLLQILTVLDDMNLEPGRVSIVQSDQYLGSMIAEELSALLPRRRPVTPATSKSARRAWQRFTSPSPSDLLASAREDAIGLPFLRAALVRLCEEYPSSGDGLSRSQRQALLAVAQGAAQTPELYRRAQAREEATFQGDAAFARVLTDLSDSRAALLSETDGSFALTALGRHVIAGDADWLESYPIDRWIGGVHLTAEHVVRWDDAAGTFTDAGPKASS